VEGLSYLPSICLFWNFDPYLQMTVDFIARHFI